LAKVPVRTLYGRTKKVRDWKIPPDTKKDMRFVWYHYENAPLIEL